MDNLRSKILEEFKDLTFIESSHSYFVGNNKLNISVSGLIDKFKIPFDSEKMSSLVAKKEGKSQEEVLKSWKTTSDKACNKGSKIHYFAECYTFSRDLKPSNGYEQSVVNFFNTVPGHIKPCLVELKMYHKQKMFAGTMDTLFYNEKSGKFVITDFKTNADLFKNYKGKRLLGPFSHLLDHSFNKYQLQLSFYQILFEQTGLEVEGRKIIHLKDDGVPLLYDCEDFTDILKLEIEKYDN